MRLRVGGRLEVAVVVMAFVIATTALACANASNQDNEDVTLSETVPTATTVDSEPTQSAIPSTPQEPLAVVTTLYPLEYFARRIGGDIVDVVNLVSPGAGAHDFEPTPDDIRTLSSADVFVYNGEGFELWVDRALDTIDTIDTQNMTLVEAAEGLGRAVAEDNNGSFDPHVWLDPLRAISQANAIREALTISAPNHAGVFNANAAVLIAELYELDSQFANSLASCEMGLFATSHRAFGYLADRYGLKAISLTGLSPEAEPNPRDLAKISDNLRAHGVAYIMAEPILSQRLADTVAREIDAQVLTMHPLESLTPDEIDAGEDYFTLMEENLRSLQMALGCS